MRSFENFNIEVVDRIPIVVRHLLAADSLLDDWAKGRIHRVNELVPIEEEPAPQILVKLEDEEEIFKTGGAADLELPVGIMFFYEDAHRVLGDEEPTASSMIQQAKRVLIANPYLNAPPYNQRITKKLKKFETLDYGGEVLEGNRFHRFIVLRVDYRSTLDVRTREVTC